jgi:hypothetical protein
LAFWHFLPLFCLHLVSKTLVLTWIAKTGALALTAIANAPQVSKALNVKLQQQAVL